MTEKQQQRAPVRGALNIVAAEKWFGAAQVIKGVSLSVAAGEFVVFVGPSGCGKSTLLRMIAGLEDTDRGNILIDGRDVTGKPPAKRRLAMVFQSYALYPHLTVRANLGFSLKMAGMTATAVAQKVEEAARVLRLEDLLERHPKALSGGQRQRVAIGRSIVREPLAFLFDEPLSNLDADLRAQMRVEIAKLRRLLRATMIYVTHDQMEAMTLADRIVVLRDGAIEQIGSPRELYEKPANLFVAGFIGNPKINIINNPAAALPRHPLPHPQAAHLGVRPEHVSLAAANDDSDCGGIVELVEYLGSDAFVYVNCDNAGVINVRTTGNTDVAVGDKVSLIFARDSVHYFSAAGVRL